MGVARKDDKKLKLRIHKLFSMNDHFCIKTIERSYQEEYTGAIVKNIVPKQIFSIEVR